MAILTTVAPHALPVGLLLLPCCSAFSTGFVASVGADHSPLRSGIMKGYAWDRSPSGDYQCWDPMPGDACDQAINWALEEGIASHPEWYADVQLLTGPGRIVKETNYKQVQDSLHRRKKAGCDKPCPRGIHRERTSATTTTEQKVEWFETITTTPVKNAEAEAKKIEHDPEQVKEQDPEQVKEAQRVIESEQVNQTEQVNETEQSKQSDQVKIPMSVVDMSVDELKSYLQGTWDGMMWVDSTDARVTTTGAPDALVTTSVAPIEETQISDAAKPVTAQRSDLLENVTAHAEESTAHAEEAPTAHAEEAPTAHAEEAPTAHAEEAQRFDEKAIATENVDIASDDPLPAVNDDMVEVSTAVSPTGDATQQATHEDDLDKTGENETAELAAAEERMSAEVNLSKSESTGAPAGEVQSSSTDESTADSASIGSDALPAVDDDGVELSPKTVDAGQPDSAPAAYDENATAQAQRSSTENETAELAAENETVATEVAERARAENEIRPRSWPQREPEQRQREQEEMEQREREEAKQRAQQKAEAEAKIRQQIWDEMNQQASTTTAAPALEAPTAEQKAYMEKMIRDKIMREMQTGTAAPTASQQATMSTIAPVAEAAPVAPTAEQKAEAPPEAAALTTAEPAQDESAPADLKDFVKDQEAQVRENLDREMLERISTSTAVAAPAVLPLPALEQEASSTAAPASAVLPLPTLEQKQEAAPQKTETVEETTARLKAEALQEVLKEKQEAEIKEATTPAPEPVQSQQIADMEAKLREEVMREMGRQVLTTTNAPAAEDMAARLRAEVLEEMQKEKQEALAKEAAMKEALKREMLTATKKVETEEEMTARLKAEALAEVQKEMREKEMKEAIKRSLTEGSQAPAAS